MLLFHINGICKARREIEKFVCVLLDKVEIVSDGFASMRNIFIRSKLHRTLKIQKQNALTIRAGQEKTKENQQPRKIPVIFQVH